MCSLLIREQVTYEVYGSLFQVKRPGESTPPPMQLSDDPNTPVTHNLQNIHLDLSCDFTLNTIIMIILCAFHCYFIFIDQHSRRSYL